MRWYTLLWEVFKAWRRDEKRVAGVRRGRCFQKKDTPATPADGVKRAKGKATVTLVSARVIRANGDVEQIDLGEDSDNG
jgi:hypothetical protein